MQDSAKFSSVFIKPGNKPNVVEGLDSVTFAHKVMVDDSGILTKRENDWIEEVGIPGLLYDQFSQLVGSIPVSAYVEITHQMGANRGIVFCEGDSKMIGAKGAVKLIQPSYGLKTVSHLKGYNYREIKAPRELKFSAGNLVLRTKEGQFLKAYILPKEGKILAKEVGTLSRGNQFFSVVDLEEVLPQLSTHNPLLVSECRFTDKDARIGHVRFSTQDQNGRYVRELKPEAQLDLKTVVETGLFQKSGQEALERMLKIVSEALHNPLAAQFLSKKDYGFMLARYVKFGIFLCCVAALIALEVVAVLFFNQKHRLFIPGMQSSFVFQFWMAGAVLIGASILLYYLYDRCACKKARAKLCDLTPFSIAPAPVKEPAPQPAVPTVRAGSLTKMQPESPARKAASGPASPAALEASDTESEFGDAVATPSDESGTPPSEGIRMGTFATESSL